MHTDEASPCGITDTFSKVMIFHHAGNVQVLKNNLVKFPNQLKAGLMKEIKALSLDLQMLFGEQGDRFASAMAAFCATAYLSLCRLQSLLSLPQQLRIINHFACRKGGKSRDPNINANPVASPGKETRLIFLYCENNVPSVSLMLDGTGLYLAVHLTMLKDFDFSNFRQMQVLPFNSERAFHLRKSKGVENFFVFEAWITRRLTSFDPAKESVKGFAQFTKRILKHLGIYACKVFTADFDFWKLNRLGVIIDR